MIWSALERYARKMQAAIAIRMPASRGTATRIRRPVPSPAAATISGDGVSPAASAAASGSPPGRAAATARAEAGRAAGSGPPQGRITRLAARPTSPNAAGRAGAPRGGGSRAGRRIGLQAAQYHAFDRRIHVANQRGGGQRRSTGSHAYQIGQRRGLKGELAGEELI